MNYAKCRIVPATVDLVHHICTHLRELDLKEVAALHGIGQADVPYVIMDDWQRHAAHGAVSVLVRGDTPLCLFGATPHAELNAAFIWMVGTNDVGAQELVRYGRKVVSDYLHNFDALFCLVWGGHTVSITWLKHLGFHFANTLHMLQSEFVLMVKHREN